MRQHLPQKGEMYSTQSTQADQVSPETIFAEAIERFPYHLEPTGITQGDLLPEDESQEVEYSEEFIFTAGQLFNEKLQAGGWIDIRYEPGAEMSISGLFGVARNGDWKNDSIFPECVGVQAAYDVVKKTWELWIDSY